MSIMLVLWARGAIEYNTKNKRAEYAQIEVQKNFFKLSLLM